MPNILTIHVRDPRAPPELRHFPLRRRLGAQPVMSAPSGCSRGRCGPTGIGFSGARSDEVPGMWFALTANYWQRAQLPMPSSCWLRLSGCGFPLPPDQTLATAAARVVALIFVAPAGRIPFPFGGPRRAAAAALGSNASARKVCNLSHHGFHDFGGSSSPIADRHRPSRGSFPRLKVRDSSAIP